MLNFKSNKYIKEQNYKLPVSQMLSNLFHVAKPPAPVAFLHAPAPFLSPFPHAPAPSLAPVPHALSACPHALAAADSQGAQFGLHDQHLAVDACEGVHHLVSQNCIFVLQQEPLLC